MRYTNACQMELNTVTGIKKGLFRSQSGYVGEFLESHSRFLLFEPLRAALDESWLSHDLLDRGAGAAVDRDTRRRPLVSGGTEIATPTLADHVFAAVRGRASPRKYPVKRSEIS